MDFLPQDIEQYAQEHTQDEPQLLKDLNLETWQTVLAPRMLSGPLQGRLLSLIAQLLRPKAILEIGTYTGYSALCLAEGLAVDGVLHTIDRNAELRSLQQKYFDRSGKAHQIIAHLGDATEILPQIDEKFDLVFIDADKSNYLNYLNLVTPMLRSGGLLISDNVLWSGKVTQEAKAEDLDTQILQEFNKQLNTHPEYQTVLLPIRDGLSLARKK
jgi:caffeoyl-CoA O-methyltransferase